ncbi:MAG: hypothetical protein AAF411_29900 [Myxococcota bacterium]
MRLFALVLPWAFACAGAAPVVVSAPPPDPITLQGRVTFDVRSATPRGVSARREEGIAAYVPVRALRENGEAIGETLTDADGRFTLETTSDAVRLAVIAELSHEGHELMVTTDNRGETPHVGLWQLEAQEPGSLRVHLSDDDPIAGAVHILQTMFRGSHAVREWTGRELPPFFCYWSRGITTNWSFYSGEVGETGRYTIELLGGEPNARSTTDTDEHDESIILHEFGHFVMDRLSSSSSHGGSHPRGVLIDPGLAWEEGRATWFAATVMQNGWYQDTVGVEPYGELRVHHDVERGIPRDLRGFGSEAGVAEILYDLSDGAPGGPRDLDDDGVTLGPGGVLQAMIEMAQEPGAFPNMRSFLRFLIRTNRATEAQLRHILLIGSHPVELLESDDEWPITLPLGTPVSGKIDGLSRPAPSGGPPRPQNGIDAVAVYRFELREAATVELRLTIDGTGTGQDHSDLDLQLRDIRSDAIAASQGETPTEVISQRLEPGFYIVYVRDGGRGNRAGFRLESRAY